MPTEYLPLANDSAGKKADKITSGGRQDNYGHPVENLERIAKLWEPIIGKPLTPREVAIMMILLKIGRDQSKPLEDNETDIAGYAILMQYCREHEERNK